MEQKTKDRIRLAVKSVMKEKVDSLVDDDIFMNNTVRDRVWDSLQSDLANDEDVEDGLLYGKDGELNDNIIELFVNDLTDAFMKRLEY